MHYRAVLQNLVSRPHQSIPHPTSSAPPSSPSLEASPASSQATWQVWSQEHPHRVGREDAGPKKTKQMLMSWGEGCVCRGVAWEAIKSWQWFRGTRKWGGGITNQKPGLEFSEGKSRSRLLNSSHKSGTRTLHPAGTPPLRPAMQTQHPRQGRAGAPGPLLGALPVPRAHRVRSYPKMGGWVPESKSLVTEVS